MRLSAQEGLVESAVCSMLIASHNANTSHVSSLTQACLPAHLVDLGLSAEEGLALLLKQSFYYITLHSSLIRLAMECQSGLLVRQPSSQAA